MTELWAVEPVASDDVMIADAQAACRAVEGDAGTVVSGVLHDATEIARIAPTTMVFAPSRGGLSHCPEEFTSDADLTVAIKAYGETLARVVERVAGQRVF